MTIKLLRRRGKQTFTTASKSALSKSPGAKKNTSAWLMPTHIHRRSYCYDHAITHLTVEGVRQVRLAVLNHTGIKAIPRPAQDWRVAARRNDCEALNGNTRDRLVFHSAKVTEVIQAAQRKEALHHSRRSRTAWSSNEDTSPLLGDLPEELSIFHLTYAEES
ncbi:hypothetical protein [Phyllobacterium endophyticum]|uniref:hypothetical protein n=1 Tax=Phyllobacterium endophyticum TaxID=1149773 RepID=UPI0011C89E49|nr:hypothetical protein [Phyllobacterium endophyticum]TXR50423.1 hypothetical protein FVA77_03785 [Phyllobacterium endophyticum]